MVTQLSNFPARLCHVRAGLPAASERQPWATPMAGTRQPLLPVRGAVSLLGCNEDRILSLIECGDLSCVFNIAGKPSECRAKELRILPHSLARFNDATPCDLGWTELLELIIPLSNPTLRATELALALNCSSTQVYNFIDRGELVATGHFSRGPRGSAEITTRSIVAFLGRRRYPIAEAAG
jgi:hypothetical protein